MNHDDTKAQGDIAERVRLLALALKDEQVSVAWNAARDLARLGPAARAALPALAAAMRSHDGTTALWARYAVARITGDTDKHLDFLIEALADKRRVFPGMAAAALAGFGAEARPAVPALIAELSDPHPDNRWSAAGALANIGPSAAAAVPALARTLQDGDDKVRWYAAWALGEIGPAALPAVEALTAALEDIDDDVRGYAARALGRIGGLVSPAALAALHRLLEDENEALRGEAETALAVFYPTTTDT